MGQANAALQQATQGVDLQGVASRSVLKRVRGRRSSGPSRSFLSRVVGGHRHNSGKQQATPKTLGPSSVPDLSPQLEEKIRHQQAVDRLTETLNEIRSLLDVGQDAFTADAIDMKLDSNIGQRMAEWSSTAAGIHALLKHLNSPEGQNPQTIHAALIAAEQYEQLIKTEYEQGVPTTTAGYDSQQYPFDPSEGPNNALDPRVKSENALRTNPARRTAQPSATAGQQDFVRAA